MFFNLPQTENATTIYVCFITKWGPPMEEITAEIINQWTHNLNQGLSERGPARNATQQNRV